MVWPPNTHQDVEDELTTVRLGFRDYFRSGYYSLGHFTGSASGAVSVPTTTALARPYMVGCRRTFDRIGLNVTSASATSSGGLIQAALYQPGLGAPGEMVLETAPISSETTGVKEFTINVNLTPGVWWTAVRTVTAACSVTGNNNTEHTTPYIGSALTPVGMSVSAWSLANASGTVAGFPAATSISTTGVLFPWVVLRAA